MIFKEPHLIPEHKWQTRRPVKPGEYGLVLRPTKPKLRFLFGRHDYYILHTNKELRNPEDKIVKVCTGNDRTKWQVGRTYAKQPGRGQKAVGRTPPIKEIRRERLQEISGYDVVAEGTDWWARAGYEEGAGEYAARKAYASWQAGNYITAFYFMWNSLYPQLYNWASNPEVWVLEFERNL